jgi:hypothetical protein
MKSEYLGMRVWRERQKKQLSIQEMMVLRPRDAKRLRLHDILTDVRNRL